MARTGPVGIAVALWVACGTFALAQPTPQDRTAVDALRAEGRWFVDGAGRVVLLRGVNLAGDSKVPPFVVPASAQDLDRLASLGFNVIRLLVIWEAYEPEPGQYHDDYLEGLRWVAWEAGRRGLHTIVDIHQDGFSRHASRGCGDGFPAWAVSPRGRASCPDNGAPCKPWPLRMALDPTTHKSFDDFYSDRHGVRTRYLAMLGRVSTAFASVPGVIGYDPINEPWGSETRELAPLYADAERVLRTQHPSAILFLEGHITTNSGLPCKLPRPAYGNVAYAPHYYHPTTLATGFWHRLDLPLVLAFRGMSGKAATWAAPLFVGEFGISATTRGGADYIASIYDQLDRHLASAAQWNVSPRWNPTAKDLWNGEDFTILTPSGQLRTNFAPRPYPRSTAGIPNQFAYGPASDSAGAWLEYHFEADPRLGVTELFLPASVFPADSRVTMSGGASSLDPAEQVLRVHAAQPGPVALRVEAPPLR